MKIASIRAFGPLAVIATALSTAAGPVSAHPLDSLSAAEIEAVVDILKDGGNANENSLYSLIELRPPDKSVVLAWKPGDPEPREAVVNVANDTQVFKGVVDIAGRRVVSWEPATGEPMLLFKEPSEAAALALADPAFIAALERRGLVPDDVACSGPSAGSFGLPEEQGRRLWKTTCSLKEKGSNGHAQPVEGLSATTDLRSKTVIEVIDTGVVPIPEDLWGYTEQEVAARPGLELRPATNPARLQQPAGPNYAIDGSLITWDMWRLRYRIDQRSGVVLSLIEAHDGADWRSVLYEAQLSEVFVPYMDPAPGWYWRTFMDSGELGFGAFLSPLRPGIDCPDYATYLTAVLHNDHGAPREVSHAICLFERDIGDPAWRHYQHRLVSGEPAPAEGRPATELVLRSASVLGNYDYLVDYAFRPNGSIDIRVGATGLDEVKGVASVSMADATAAEDTRYGTLIAPNLVAPNHDHYFNFRLDFDIDGRENGFMRTALERTELPAGSPRRSLWTTSNTMPMTELAGRYRVDPATPAMYHVVNMGRTSCLGHHPGYMILPNDSVAYSLLDANDPPAKRNAYIDYTIWNTPYDPDERYAGGEYATQSDGSDGLAVWVQKDRPIHDTDIVSWYTMGFHHVPHMEDWPVMSMTWKGITLMPFNFFCINPATTLRIQ